MIGIFLLSGKEQSVIPAVCFFITGMGIALGRRQKAILPSVGENQENWSM